MLTWSRYLPRYGMSPELAGAVRHSCSLLAGVAFLITWIFDADVNAQGGAYATVCFVLMTSAAGRSPGRPQGPAAPAHRRVSLIASSSSTRRSRTSASAPTA